MATTGFIGTGTIGAPMAGRLLEGGYSLMVCDRAPEAVAAMAAQGAQVAADAGAVAAVCATVFLSLPGPQQVEAVVLGEGGLLSSAGALRTIVDLSTNDLALNRRLAAVAAEHGVDYLDAPVSGGAVAARKGALTVMVGGDAAAFERVRPLIACFGEHVHHLGPAGAGTLTKLVNNQLFLCASVLLQEAFLMGAASGMTPDELLPVLETSSAGAYVAHARMLLSQRYDLGVFALGIAEKDIALALAAGEAAGVAMPATAAAHGVYREALAQGLGDADFFATLKVLEERAGSTLPAPGKRR